MPSAQTSTAAMVTFTTQATTSRAEALAARAALHPNPAQQRFTLTLPAGLLRQPSEAVLYNGLGQVVQRRPLPTSSQEAAFEVGGLPRGIYVLQLATPAGLISKRVVVE